MLLILLSIKKFVCEHEKCRIFVFGHIDAKYVIRKRIVEINRLMIYLIKLFYILFFVGVALVDLGF